MRIAYLINQYPKVSHSFIRREIQALERLGIDVMRISIRGWNEPLADPDDLNERKRTRYVLRDGTFALLLATLRAALVRPRYFLRAFALAIKMARRSDRLLPVHLVYLAEACRIFWWLKRDNVDHLHAHFGTNSAEVAMQVHVLGGPRWSFTVHGPEEFDRAKQIGLPEKVRWASFVVAISSFGRSQLYRLLDHTHWSKVKVVRCGVDCKFIGAQHERRTNPKRLVCVGRICEQKGQLLLLAATHRLAVKGLDFELVFGGDGEMRSEVEALIKEYGLTNRVRITGWLTSDEVREQILAARALVLPSFGEGLPVVLIEAMALQRPVISTFIAGIPELVTSGRNGWLVPASDVEALADAMERCLAASEHTLFELGLQAERDARLLHDTDSEVAKLVQLFTF